MEGGIVPSKSDLTIAREGCPPLPESVANAVQVFKLNVNALKTVVEFKGFIVRLINKMKRVLEVVNENIEAASVQLGQLEVLENITAGLEMVPSKLIPEFEKKVMCNVPHFLVIEQSFPNL